MSVKAHTTKYTRDCYGNKIPVVWQHCSTRDRGNLPLALQIRSEYNKLDQFNIGDKVELHSYGGDTDIGTVTDTGDYFTSHEFTGDNCIFYYCYMIEITCEEHISTVTSSYPYPIKKL